MSGVSMASSTPTAVEGYGEYEGDGGGDFGGEGWGEGDVWGDDQAYNQHGGGGGGKGEKASKKTKESGGKGSAGGGGNKKQDAQKQKGSNTNGGNGNQWPVDEAVWDRGQEYEGFDGWNDGEGEWDRVEDDDGMATPTPAGHSNVGLKGHGRSPQDYSPSFPNTGAGYHPDMGYDTRPQVREYTS